nr:MAG TPA: hypothetical protein [Caudoviricetes sp.]
MLHTQTKSGSCHAFRGKFSHDFLLKRKKTQGFLVKLDWL